MRRQFVIFILIMSAAIIAAAPARSAEEQVTSIGQVTFVSGGIGEDSANRMASLGKDFNLKLLFATKDGHYLADVAVTILDGRGGRVLETVSEGPFLLVRLAPGKYRVIAVFEKESFTRRTTVPGTGQRELIFRWVEPTEQDELAARDAAR